MKTYMGITLTLLLTMVICGSTANAAAEQNDSTDYAPLIQAKALVMRLDIINATDQSKFTKAEKRILRKEVRHIKGDLKELRGGRYVPTIFIVLLLLVPVTVFQLTE